MLNLEKEVVNTFFLKLMCCLLRIDESMYFMFTEVKEVQTMMNL